MVKYSKYLEKGVVLMKYIKSPLNYVGGKYKLLNQIIPLLPNNIKNFIDLFSGGGNVGININAIKIIYNDIESKIIGIFDAFKKYDKQDIFDNIFQIINEYMLSRTDIKGYDYYKCTSDKGVGSYNKEYYLKLREWINNQKIYDYKYYLKFYVLLIYAFNNQIRFNNKGRFNMPVGKRDFNSNIQQKLSNFIDKLKEQNCAFTSCSYDKYDFSNLDKNDFVYCDPPYLNSIATYNKMWSEQDEKMLLIILDKLNDKNIKFALSNNLKYNNVILDKWKNKYNVYYLDNNYSNCNYQKKDKSKDVEILITNY